MTVPYGPQTWEAQMRALGQRKVWGRCPNCDATLYQPDYFCPSCGKQRDYGEVVK